ncbi:MAG: FkbM family methyltransferase, partial [Oscillatoriales cyanobacterium SM2_1_8]|nr:FkbM family methyltransferase [Oscillatoriales cyanobacterium SM2_1_8]
RCIYPCRNQPGLQRFPAAALLSGGWGIHGNLREITVPVVRLDDAIPATVKIAWIKIDVEGGEQQVLAGATGLLKRDRPYVVFEHGLGAADCYGTTPETIWDLFTECTLAVSTLERWLEGKAALDREGFRQAFYSGEYYFLAYPAPIWQVLDRQVATLQGRLDTVARQHALERQVSSRLQQEIAAMASSKFWQARELWFRLKKNCLLGEVAPGPSAPTAGFVAGRHGLLGTLCPGHGEPPPNFDCGALFQPGGRNLCLPAISANGTERRFALRSVGGRRRFPGRNGGFGISDWGGTLRGECRELGFFAERQPGGGTGAGEWVLLLNNDVEVLPGWLPSLWSAITPTTGAVVSQLVYPNGRLQEAGGILWRDGRATNFGRGDDPQKPEYQFVRPVDYGSAASLLVRRSLWEAIGGFDEIYAPAYYEDADLAMALRQRGYQVLYQPRSVAVHREGTTLGTDLRVGGKSHQALNRWRFAVKWASALQSHYLPEEAGDRLASRRLQGKTLPLADRMPVRWDQFQAWQEEGYALSLWLPDSPAADRDRLQQLGVEVLPTAREFTRCLSCCFPT